MNTIYLIYSEDSNAYKIGVSSNVKRRLKQLQTASSSELILIKIYSSNNSYQIEKTIHRLWNHKKYKQNDFCYLEGEWFYLENQDIANFENTCKQIDENLIFVKNNKLNIF